MSATSLPRIASHSHSQPIAATSSCPRNRPLFTVLFPLGLAIWGLNLTSSLFVAIAQADEPGTEAAKAAQPSLASCFPASTAIYAEMRPADEWFDHPLRSQLFKSEAFLQIWRSPEVVKARGGLTLAELVLGDKLENIARQLTTGGLAVGFDRRYEGTALVTRTEDAKWLEGYAQRLLKLARGDQPEKVQIEEANYRGIRAYKVDKLVLSAVDDVLVVSDKRDLAREIVDRLLDSATPDSGLPATDFYQTATSLTNSSESADKQPPIVVAAFDLRVLREAGVAKELFQGEANDFAGELILGGLLGVLHEAPCAYGELTLETTGPLLSLVTPYQHDWLGEPREHYVGPDGRGAATPLVKSKDAIAALSIYRNISHLWLWAGDLFDERVNDDLAQADTTLTTLFSGHDFGTEILGAIYPELQLIVSQPDFSAIETPPSIQLPSFALVARLREPDFMRGELKRIFQSLIGLINITGAMNGQPQLDLGDRHVGQEVMYTAEFVRPIDAQRDTPPPIQFNFSPSLAFVGDQAILASTIQQAERLARDLSSSPQPQLANELSQSQTVGRSNTRLNLDAAGLHSVLALNREQLIAQNMLEKGHSREEAEQEIAGLLSLITLFDAAELTLGFQPQVELNIHLQLKQ